MNSTLSKAFIFATGAAIGAVVTWKVLETKYDKIVEKELESIRETYRDKIDSDKSRIEKLEEVSDYIKDNFETGLNNSKPNLMEYAATVMDNGYTSENLEKGDLDELAGPYVIAPEEYDELEDYEAVSLTYYDDKVLAYFDGEIIEDIEGTVGFDALTSFGEYEDDAVHVRNNHLNTDYEILRDHRRYEDVYPDYDE